MIIDVHAHVFPDSLAPRALAALTENAGDYVPFTDSTLSGLIVSMKISGVDRSWIASIATKPAQAASILKWSATISSPGILPLGSVHPRSPDFESEIVAYIDAGFSGIKLHPLYQDFLVDDRALDPFFTALERSGMFLLLHAGNDAGFPGMDNASPQRIVRLLSRFPSLPLIAAHFGGWQVWPAVFERLAGLPCYFDTSFIGEVPQNLRDAIFEKHGIDNFVFGTDSPWQDQGEQVRLIKNLPLSAVEKEKIFSLNALRLLETILPRT